MHSFELSKTPEYNSVKITGLYDGGAGVFYCQIIINNNNKHKLFFSLFYSPWIYCFKSSYWFQKQFGLGLWWAQSWLWRGRKHRDAGRSWVVMGSSERCHFQEAGIHLMNVSKCNKGSRLPQRNRKYIFLQHLLGLWLTSDSACLGNSDPSCHYQLWVSLG